MHEPHPGPQCDSVSFHDGKECVTTTDLDPEDGTAAFNLEDLRMHLTPACTGEAADERAADESALRREGMTEDAAKRQMTTDKLTSECGGSSGAE
ncbi:hypothetical protein MRX96_049384 [Rhipicephalus microplus]